jgi:hypothetical protein
MSNINALPANVPKLSGNNCHEWKFSLMMVLQCMGSWSIVSGGTKKPVDEYSKEYFEWAKHSEDSYTAIGLTISLIQQLYIQDYNSGPETWAALVRIYQANNHANRILLKQQLYMYHHDTKKPVMEYVHGIFTLTSQLQVIGVKLGEEDMPDVLIYSLVPKFSVVVTGLMQRAGSLTIEDISVALKEEESHLKG